MFLIPAVSNPMRFSSLILVSVLQIMDTSLGEASTLLSAILNSVGSPAFLSILGARLLFNMREAGEKGLNEGTSCGSKSTVSGIDFAEPPQAAMEHSQEELGRDEAIEMEEIC